MTIIQGALTVITRIAPGRTESLRSLLNGIGDAVESNELVPFVQMTTVHFARWVILPERRSDADSATFPAQLVLSTSYDGPLDPHIEEIIRVGRRGFDSIYEHCVGYPDAEGRTSASVLAYLRSHAVDHAIFYVGAPGVSLSRVHEESRLRHSIEEFLDGASVNTDGWTGRTETDVRRAVRDHVGGDPSQRWALEPLDHAVRTLLWYGWVGLTFVAVLIAVRRNPPGVFDHPCEVHQIPSHERRVAIGEIVFGAAGPREKRIPRRRCGARYGRSWLSPVRAATGTSRTRIG